MPLVTVGAEYSRLSDSMGRKPWSELLARDTCSVAATGITTPKEVWNRS